MTLLRVHSPRWEIEIDGPHEPPAATMAGVDVGRPGLVRISGNGPDTEVEYLSPTGAQIKRSPEDEQGPLWFEDTAYSLYVYGDEHVPAVRHRDPLFGKNLSRHPRQRVISGPFNFGRQVGKTTFDVEVGPECISVTLEVVPTKLDYQTDYQRLVSEVQSVTRGLALAFMRSTHQSAAHGTDTASPLDWIAGLRGAVHGLSGSIGHINRHPYRHLHRRVELAATHRLKRPDSVARRSIMRGKGTGSAVVVPGVGIVRERIPAVVARTTMDTPEHRWIANQLSEIELRLQQMAREMGSTSQPESSNRSSERDAARSDEVTRIARRVDHVRRLEVLSAASQLKQAVPPSLTLMSAPGYREAYRALTSLRLALEVRGGALELEMKDLHELYEIWCYLETVSIASRIAGENPEFGSLIHTSANGLHIAVMRGRDCDVRLTDHARTLTLAFNRTYDGDTGRQRPDIVLILSYPSRPELVIVLDAKYRVDASSQYRQQHGAPGPPIDAMNELHRYRDAIVRNFGTQAYRPTVRAVALFPLTQIETAGYEANSGLCRSLRTLGVGALPFLPGNTELVEAWLRELLGLPDEQLAWNGPPGPAMIDQQQQCMTAGVASERQVGNADTLATSA